MTKEKNKGDKREGRRSAGRKQKKEDRTIKARGIQSAPIKPWKACKEKENGNR